MPLAQRPYDELHAANTESYERRVKRLYSAAVTAVSEITVPLSLDPNADFYFRNYPLVNDRINALMRELQSEVYATVTTGMEEEWALAVDKNNELANYAFGETVLRGSKALTDEYLASNQRAQRAFMLRKDNGLGLSGKIWSDVKQFKQELELALQVSIGQGKSAAQLASSIKYYLNDPDRLYRGVRDESGVLRLSRAALAYNPGQGRYRSSYKNALRLARNEINFSYEKSNFLKREQQSFIVGVRISVSPNHNPNDDKGGISCFSLQGDYPKTFDFTYKWHTNCKCRSLHILKTREELNEDLDKILAGGEPTTKSINTVDKIPKSFTNYVKDTSPKWKNWKNEPRFLTTNAKVLSEKS